MSDNHLNDVAEEIIGVIAAGITILRDEEDKANHIRSCVAKILEREYDAVVGVCLAKLRKEAEEPLRNIVEDMSDFVSDN